jgi:drug/metabolite transporter (DMT)-like permease
MWSFQYIFLRVAVPAFGTAAVAEGRALSAALFLVPWVAWVARQRIGPLEHWRDHLAVALVNNVAPFVCFAWAATVLPAGYLAIINGMVPLWAAVIAVPVLQERLSGPAWRASRSASPASRSSSTSGRYKWAGTPSLELWSPSPAPRSGAGPGS